MKEEGDLLHTWLDSLVALGTDGKSPFLSEASKQTELAVEKILCRALGYREQNRGLYPRKREVNLSRDDADCMEVVGSRLVALTLSKISWSLFWERLFHY